MSSFAQVQSPEQLKQAIGDGAYIIEIVGPIVFEREDQCIIVDSKLRSPSLGNPLKLYGHGANWLGQIVRRHSGDLPLITIGSLDNSGKPLRNGFDGAEVHWELRGGGFVLQNWNSDYRGPGLHIGYCQQSILSDIRFEGWNDEPCYINGNGNRYSFFQFYYSKTDGHFDGVCADVFEQFTINSDWGERNRGIKIVAGPHDEVTRRSLGVACHIIDPHVEGTINTITGFKQGVLYEGGHHLGATIYANNMASGAFKVDSAAMSWYVSEMKINGFNYNPKLQRFF
jgi:hypothetical protein